MFRCDALSSAVTRYGPNGFQVRQVQLSDRQRNRQLRMGRPTMPVVNETMRMTHIPGSFSLAVAAAVAVLAVFAVVIPSARAGEIASDWVEGHKNRVRMSAGSLEGAQRGTVMAFIEIELADGWKTYWRNPGPAGGLPPAFDFSASRNVASARALYPVPQVMSDQAGDVIGYKSNVIFPIRVEIADLEQPVSFEVAASYGICESVCVPVDVTLRLDLPPSSLPAIAGARLAALEAVPREGDALRPDDPSDIRIEGRPEPGASKVLISARFPGGADYARIFLDAPDGRFVPIPVTKGTDGDRVTFEADFGDAQSVDAVRGLALHATLAGSLGHSIQTFVID